MGRTQATTLREGMLVGGRYRLKRALSSGGMASLWVARNEALDIDVALKWILPELADVDDSRLSERMLNEARAAARLGHPAIVRVLDFDETSRGEPFIVMELLDGEDLASALQRRGRVSAVKALKILLPIAHALAAAHEQSIVHRDVKPENIFLVRTADGRMQPKLIDFGVAKLEAKVEERITSVGAIVGSPHYLSPEQACGEDADPRADIWSFCVVLYEMISGRRPFEARNTRALLRTIIEDEPTPATHFGAGDAALWALMERGFAKHPDDRWTSMRGFGEALADWLLNRHVHEDVCGGSLHNVWLADLSDSKAFSTMPPPPEASRPSFVHRDTQLPQSSADELADSQQRPSEDAPQAQAYPASGGDRSGEDGPLRRATPHDDFAPTLRPAPLPSALLPSASLPSVSLHSAAPDAFASEPQDISETTPTAMLPPAPQVVASAAARPSAVALAARGAAGPQQLAVSARQLLLAALLLAVTSSAVTWLLMRVTG